VWQKEEKTAYARLGDGQGELSLARVEGTEGPVVIQNLWWFPGDRVPGGVHLYWSTHHYQGHGLDYTLKGASGFIMELEAGTP
jgi:hypothetical protein